MNKIRLHLSIVLVVITLSLTPLFVHVVNAGLLSPQAQIIMDYDWKFGTDQVPNTSPLDHRHMTVSEGCDVNGDGYDDLLVGDRDYSSSGYTQNGRAWLFLGSVMGLSITPDLTFDPPVNNTYGFFGTQVACAGDIDGDGDEEIMIGMDNYDNSYPDEGAVFVYYGANPIPSATYSWMARGYNTYAHLGITLDGAGDVNGDGYDVIIAGTFDTYSYAGRDAYIWYGGPTGLGDTGLPTNADWYASGPAGSIDFGLVVRGIGDVDGNGCDDVMVGASGYDGAFTNQGAVYVWYGSTSGLGDMGTQTNADWMATSDQEGAVFGFGGDGVGDLNGDGFDDLVIGAHGYDNPETSEGKIFVWYGSSNGLGDAGTPTNADWSAEANDVGYLGYVARSAGDVNRDGYDDLLATAHIYPFDASGTPLSNAGAWFIWLGSETGLGDPGTPDNADLAGYGDQENGRLGRDNAGAADVNGDGLDEIFVAAFYYDDGQTDEGVVFGYDTPYQLIFLPVIVR
jgi:hypothetical protein